MMRVLVACFAMMAGQAAADSKLMPISEVTEINKPLTAAAVAYEIEQGCPTIERRAIRVAIEGWKVAVRAQELGYTRRQIKAFVRSDEHKARLQQTASTIIAGTGVDTGDQTELCAFGEAQIKSRTFAGRLLRVVE